MSEKPFRDLSPQDFGGNNRIYNAVSRAYGGSVLEFVKAVEKADGPKQFVKATRFLGEKSLPLVEAAYEKAKKEVETVADALLEEVLRIPEPYHGGLLMPGWSLESRVGRLETRMAEMQRQLEELRQLVEAMPAAIKALLG